jgi:ATPase family associated with various cellular activities (AAA)
LVHVWETHIHQLVSRNKLGLTTFPTPNLTIKMLSTAAGIISTAGMATAGALTVMGAFVKQRLYTSVNNRVETHQIVDVLRRQPGCYACAERSIDGQWTPTVVVSPQFCASVTVHTSQYDVTQQSIEATVWLPCWMSWSAFHEHHLKKKAVDDGSDDEDHDGSLAVDSHSAHLATKLYHAEISGSSLAWPDWNAEKRLVFPPGVPEAELALADSLAATALAHVRRENGGSAIFVANGAPQTGKTSAGLRLAQRLGSNTIVARSYRPIQPGHMLSAIERVRTELGDKDAYIVVLLNEFDTWMDGFASENNQNLKNQHPKLVTEVTNKETWNEWADAIYRKERIIVWMTTNSDLEGYDPALLRPKRVTARYMVHDQTSFETVFAPPEVKAEVVKPEVNKADVTDNVKADVHMSRASSVDSTTCLTTPLLLAMSRHNE